LQSFGPTGADVSIVRPTYVAGPYDYTGRFTWWVERVARGAGSWHRRRGTTRSRSSTARDLADFVALLAHGRARGPFTPSARGRRSRGRASSAQRWTPWGRPGLSSFGSTRKLLRTRRDASRAPALGRPGPRARHKRPGPSAALAAGWRPAPWPRPLWTPRARTSRADAGQRAHWPRTGARGKSCCAWRAERRHRIRLRRLRRRGGAGRRDGLEGEGPAGLSTR